MFPFVLLTDDAGASIVTNDYATGGGDTPTYYYGYSAANSSVSADAGVFGSISASSVRGRTIRTAAMSSLSDDFSGERGYILELAGEDIPNTDATFVQIMVNGETLARSAASYIADTGAETSMWIWTLSGSFYPNATHTLIAI